MLPDVPNYRWVGTETPIGRTIPWVLDLPLICFFCLHARAPTNVRPGAGIQRKERPGKEMKGRCAFFHSSQHCLLTGRGASLCDLETERCVTCWRS